MSISVEFQERFIDLISELDDIKKSSVPKTIGIHYSTFSNAINYGAIPQTPILVRIADYFNISIEYLLGRTQDNYFIKSDNPVPFLARLEELRQEKQLSYYKLSRKMHIGTNQFANWKKSKSLPYYDNLVGLAQILKVSIDYLLGRTDDK